MKKRKYRTLYYLSILLFVCYFVLNHLAGRTTLPIEKVHLKILHLLPFILLLAFYGLNSRTDKNG